MQNWIRTSLFLLTLAALAIIGSQSGRADLSAYQANSEAYLLPVKTGETIEQTFISAHADMKAVWLFSSVKSDVITNAYSLRFALYSRTMGEEKLLAAQTISLADAAAHPRLEFQFPTQTKSANQEYRLVVTSNAPAGLIDLYASREDRYIDGALFINRKVQPADLAFQVMDAVTPWNWIEDPGWFFHFLGQGLLLFLFLLVTGVSILILIGNFWYSEMSDWVILALACGIGLNPILYQVFSLLHIPVTALRIVLFVFMLGLLAAIKVIIRFKGRSFKQAWSEIKGQGFTVILLGFFLLSFALRIAQVRDLSAPSWTDGLFHLNLIERILANQGIPQGLLYHTGYHTLVTIYFTLFRGDLPLEMLVIGQLINALVGLTFLILARKLLRNRWAGLMAACLIWFLAPFPAYLFNWGRYPFLLGLVMLSPLLTVCLSFCQERTWSHFILAGYLLLGTVLCHYGMFTLWMSFLITAFIMFAWNAKKTAISLPGRIRLRIILPLAFILLVVVGLLINRTLPLIGAEKIIEIVQQSREAAQAQDYRELVGIAFRGPGALFGVLCLYGIGLVWQIDRKILSLVSGWLSIYALLVVLFAPLLGESIASYTNLIIFASLPLALLGGITAAWLLEPIQRQAPAHPSHSRNQGTSSARKWPVYLQVALFFALLIFGAGSSFAGQMNPATVLLTPADRQAMQWIRDNPPGHARFLINSTGWGDRDIVTSEGGGWLQAVTGRQIVFWHQEPPARANPISSFPDRWDYLYLGKGSGFLHVADLPDSQIPYRIVYQEGGITIVQKK